MTQLAIKWPFSFPPHSTSAFALLGENKNKQNITFLFNAILLFD